MHPYLCPPIIPVLESSPKVALEGSHIRKLFQYLKFLRGRVIFYDFHWPAAYPRYE